MSKKITSFLFLLLAICFSSNAVAQEDTGLADKGISLGVALEDFEPGTWYFLYQGRTPSKAAGAYAFPTVGEEVDPDGGLMTDMGEGQSIQQLRAGNVPEGSYATDYAGSLVRFIPVDDKEGVFNIQFGTGRWMTGPAGTGNSKEFKTSNSLYDAGEFNFYKVPEADDSGENRSTFGFNVYDMGQRVDNDGPGRSVVTWNSGQHTSIGSTNSIWTVVEVQWVEVDPLDVAQNRLADVIQEYSTYAGQFNTGDKPGQYSPEAVENLENELAKADDLEFAEDLTIEMIDQAIEAIKQAYEAILASRVPLTVADGYYRFRNAMPYVASVPLEGGEEGETEEVEVTKYMYTQLQGDVIYGMWGSRNDLASDAASLWKITNKEGGLDIQNMGYESRFTAVKMSTNVVLSAESDSLMVIEPAYTEEEFTGDVTYVNIRLASQDANARFYLHQNGHGASDGVGHNAGGNLVGWESGYTYGNGTVGASEWVLESVSDADAQSIIEAFEPIKNRTAMLAAYDSIMTNAQQNLKIAATPRIKTTVDDDSPLVTDASQFSSPYSQNDLGAPDGGNLADGVLIDGNADTYWHSYWGANNVPGGTHYLQVEMPDMELTNVAFVYTRRNVANDHMTECGVFGTNDPDAEKADCEELSTEALPFTAADETLTSGAFPTKGYKYLRFYCNNTEGSGITSTRGYFHMAEFQLYPATMEQLAEAQESHMGDLFATLQSVVDAQADLTEEQIQIEHYNALKQAYDAFMQKFVDPAELRQTLADVDGKSAIIAIGTQPGFWADNATGEALDKTIAAATAYDASGDYTPAQSQQYVETLKAQAEAIDAAAIGIQTDKWYRIRFATEEEFDEHGWDKVAGNEQYNSTIEATTSPALFGKYITAATLYSEEVAQNITVYEVESADASELGLGSQLFLMDEADNTSGDDLAQFRFIAVGDTAYLLQNRATGLFVKAAGTSGAVSLSAHPSLFTHSAIGYGLNALPAKSITGDDQKYLHAQVSQNILVTWGPNFEPYAGSRSGFYIEEAEDVAADFTGEEFNLPVLPGTLTTLCYPVDLSLKEGEKATLWDVESVNVDSATVTLTRIQGTVNAGRPFILVQTDEYDAEEEETVMVVLKHANAVTALEPQTENLLKGTFAQTSVGAGVLVAEGNTLAPTKQSNATLAANKAYVADEKAYDRDAEFTLNYGDVPDAIQTIVAGISRPAAVYTLDGRLVSRKASINQLSRGIYVINGTKVIIK